MRNRVVFGAFAIAELTHLALSYAWPHAGWTTSLGTGLSLLVMVAFCLKRGDRADFPGMDWRWRVLALALLLWLAAYGAIAWLQCVVHPGSPRFQPDELLYALRGGPYLLLLCRTGEADEKPIFGWIDSAQVMLFGLLWMLLIFPVASWRNGVPLVSDDLAMRYHDIQNIGMAALSVLAFVGQPPGVRRRFYRALAVLLVGYAAAAAILNHIVADYLDPPPGSAIWILFDLLFPLFVIIERAGARTNGSAVAAIRRLDLRLILPAMFCAFSLIAAFAVARREPVIGLAGGALALALKTARSTLLQSGVLRLQRFLAAALDGLPEAVCITGSGSRVILANEAARALFGQKLEGRNLDELRAAVLDQTARDGGVYTLSGRSFVVGEASLPDGDRVASWTDVTHVRDAERSREEALQFLSHDIRSPHAAIVSLLESEDARCGALSPEMVSRIRRYAKHGLSLADGFVHLARVQTAAIDAIPVDVIDAVAEAIDMAWPLVRKRSITIEEPSEVSDAWIRGDRAILIRMVHNLLDNAIKYGPHGSTVRLEVRLSATDVSIEVQNFGPPFSEDRRENPFRRFGASQTAHSTGLGLAFVDVAAKRLGGHATYRSRNELHIFSIELPRQLDDHGPG